MGKLISPFKPTPAQNALEHFLDGHIAHWIVGTLILINSLILGLETSQSFMKSYGPLLQQTNLIISWIFVGEMLLRIAAARLQFFRKPLDLLDLFAVGMAVASGYPSFMVLRLIRVLRLFLLHNFSPRMKHLLHGFYHALPGVLHTFGLVIVLFYIASVLAVALFNHPELQPFQTIGSAMKTLFQVLSGDDWFAVMRGTEKFFPYAWIFFIAFYVIMVFVVLNLFIGIVVGALQAIEQNNEGPEKNEMEKDIKKIQSELRQIRQLLQKD